jgi:undecaprenyl diphosphate synthase
MSSPSPLRPAPAPAPYPINPEGGAVPQHVAVIMDGNRRWARARGMPAVFGHQRGAESVRRVVEGCLKRGIPHLTLFAFSSENWRRSPAEITELMNLLRFYLRREIAEVAKNGVQVRFIGEREFMADDIRELMAEAEARTCHNRALVLMIALNYGSRREIARAARVLAERVAAGELESEDVDETLFDAAMNGHGVPDPDLLIRTSGEQRLSNFMLWQLAYAELVFLPVKWPEFDQSHLDQAIAEFQKRERRYGASSG